MINIFRGITGVNFADVCLVMDSKVPQHFSNTPFMMGIMERQVASCHINKKKAPQECGTGVFKHEKNTYKPFLC